MEEWISGNPVVVFSKTWCPYCQNAKEALASVGADFLAVELDERDDGADIQSALTERTGVKTVPRVFINGTCIGGGDDTVRLRDSGELSGLVSAALSASASSSSKELPAFSPDQMAASSQVGWAIRTTNLERTTEFLTKVCGMKVLSTEQFAGPCSITRNGSGSAAWSKTVLGYGTEGEGYSLELIYNEGTTSYPAGTGLTHFALGLDDPEVALSIAEGLGYTADGDVVKGPDGYCFRFLPYDDFRKERFLYVGLRVAELPKAVDFYGQVLGMTDLTMDFEHLAFNRGGVSLMRVVGYAPEQVPLILFEDPMTNQELKLQEWEGRNWLAVPEEVLQAACKKVEEVNGEKAIVHKVQEFDHNKGKLLGGVVKDADGYEICLVGLETYTRVSAKRLDLD